MAKAKDERKTNAPTDDTEATNATVNKGNDGSRGQITETAATQKLNILSPVNIQKSSRSTLFSRSRKLKQKSGSSNLYPNKFSPLSLDISDKEEEDLVMRLGMNHGERKA